MMDMASTRYNISYHPILNNYPVFDNITRAEFDNKLELPFAFLIEEGEKIDLVRYIRYQDDEISDNDVYYSKYFSPAGMYEALHHGVLQCCR